MDKKAKNVFWQIWKYLSVGRGQTRFWSVGRDKIEKKYVFLGGNDKEQIISHG